LAAGRAADASLFFQNAARYPELFYGQLALERIGRSVTTPGPAPVVTEQQRMMFGGNRLARATRLLGGQNRAEQTLFVRALAESLNNDGDRALAVELGQQIGRQDLGVWVARAARNKGSAFFVRQAYPTMAGAPSGRQWSLAHGIARQESSFDRTAVSHAGARGLMQLMLPTAREQAGKMGVGYDSSRLTSDPAYNVMLGSAYFQRLLNTWDGNVPLAVASYNAGAGNVRKWVRNYGDPRHTDVLRWIERIPFMETRGYVQRVIENSVVYDSMRQPQSPQAAMHVSQYLGKSRPG
jgi:soluble lytic murein transglycosylase